MIHDKLNGSPALLENIKISFRLSLSAQFTPRVYCRVVRQKQIVRSSAEFREAWRSIGFAEKWLVTKVNKHGMMLVIEPLAKDLKTEIVWPSPGIGVPAR